MYFFLNKKKKKKKKHVDILASSPVTLLHKNQELVKGLEGNLYEEGLVRSAWKRLRGDLTTSQLPCCNVEEEQALISSFWWPVTGPEVMASYCVTDGLGWILEISSSPRSLLASPWVLCTVLGTQGRARRKGRGLEGKPEEDWLRSLRLFSVEAEVRALRVLHLRDGKWRGR